MKKSGSCPNLQTVHTKQASLSIIRNNMKKSGSCHSIVCNATIEQTYPQIPSQHYEIERTTHTGQEFYMAVSAPAHVVGMCMMANPDDVPGVIPQERDKNLAACIASPCDTEESPIVIIDGVRKYAYIMTNENRAGEIISRIRRLKRNQKR